MIFEVPSNIILYKVGARLWIARIMVTWGIFAMAMSLVQNEWSFYLLRFLQIGFLTAIPYVGASIGLVLLAAHSDRHNERVLHYAVPALVGTGGLALAAFTATSSPVLALTGFTLGAIGCISTLPCFWAETPKLLTGVAAAAGIALVSSIGNIAGFVSPYMVALIKGENASASGTTNAILACAGFLLLAALVMLAVGRSNRRRRSARARTIAQ